VWSNGANTQNLTNLTAGSYTVTVTDAKKCTAMSSVTLSEPASLNVSSNINGNSASIVASGGTLPYTYNWSNGFSDSYQGNLPNGSYTVYVTDANKCPASTKITINVPEKEKVTICHIPPGDPDNPQRITIAKSALAAHLAHGDQLGECTPKKVEEEKVTICHLPPGNPNNPQTITIAKSALAAHLAHGDQLGTCIAKVEEEKVTICHIPPGNPDNPQTITIAKSALAAHLAHGDQLGECVPKKVEEEKVTICHIPPGNPDNPQTITIAKSALAAHLAHGDK
jgi:transposase